MLEKLHFGRDDTRERGWLVGSAAVGEPARVGLTVEREPAESMWRSTFTVTPPADAFAGAVAQGQIEEMARLALALIRKPDVGATLAALEQAAL